MLNKLILQTAVVLAILSLAPAHAQRGAASPTDEVRAAETAFAKSMADRNAAAFAALLGDEAVFFGSKAYARKGGSRRGLEAIFRWARRHRSRGHLPRSKCSRRARSASRADRSTIRRAPASAPLTPSGSVSATGHGRSSSTRDARHAIAACEGRNRRLSVVGSR